MHTIPASGVNVSLFINVYAIGDTVVDICENTTVSEDFRDGIDIKFVAI